MLTLLLDDPLLLQRHGIQLQLRNCGLGAGQGGKGQGFYLNVILKGHIGLTGIRSVKNLLHGGILLDNLYTNYYTTEYGKIASRKSVDNLEYECYTIQEGLF